MSLTPPFPPPGPPLRAPTPESPAVIGVRGMSTRLSSWLKGLGRRPAGAGPRRARVRLEPLEGRLAPAIFNVNSTADILHPPPGIVTLRSAIEAANANPGFDFIQLTVGGTYKITIPGSGEDNNARGDFDILPTGGSLSIFNAS